MAGRDPSAKRTTVGGSRTADETSNTVICDNENAPEETSKRRHVDVAVTEDEPVASTQKDEKEEELTSPQRCELPELVEDSPISGVDSSLPSSPNVEEDIMFDDGVFQLEGDLIRACYRAYGVNMLEFLANIDHDKKQYLADLNSLIDETEQAYKEPWTATSSDINGEKHYRITSLKMRRLMANALLTDPEESLRGRKLDFEKASCFKTDSIQVAMDFSLKDWIDFIKHGREINRTFANLWFEPSFDQQLQCPHDTQVLTAVAFKLNDLLDVFMAGGPHIVCRYLQAASVDKGKYTVQRLVGTLMGSYFILGGSSGETKPHLRTPKFEVPVWSFYPFKPIIDELLAYGFHVGDTFDFGDTTHPGFNEQALYFRWKRKTGFTENITDEHSDVPGSLVVNFPLVWCTDEKTIGVIRKTFDAEVFAKDLVH